MPVRTETETVTTYVLSCPSCGTEWQRRRHLPESEVLNEFCIDCRDRSCCACGQLLRHVAVREVTSDRDPDGLLTVVDVDLCAPCAIGVITQLLACTIAQPADEYATQAQQLFGAYLAANCDLWSLS